MRQARVCGVDVGIDGGIQQLAQGSLVSGQAFPELRRPGMPASPEQSPCAPEDV